MLSLGIWWSKLKLERFLHVSRFRLVFARNIHTNTMAAGTNASDQSSATQQYYNQPIPELFEKPYTPPPEPKNPVLRGLPLSYGASL